MEFRIRKDARRWFRDVQAQLTARPGTTSAPDFDAFYFCFVAGITAKRKKDVQAAETAGIVEHFPGPYRIRGRLIVGLFVSRELELLGIGLYEKATVHAEIARLVRPDAPNFLSDAGVREFNKYAHGGYEVLLDWFDDRPRALEVFLRRFRSMIEDVLAHR